MSNANSAAALVRLLATFVDSLSEDDVEGLLAGRLGLHITGGEPTFRSKRKRGTVTVDLDVVVDALGRARTRHDAMSILERGGITKALLEKLARRLDLPVLRSDSVERLRQKIVEGVVGHRINSEAIQGVHPSLKID